MATSWPTRCASIARAAYFVAVSGWGGPPDDARVREHGFAILVPKPCDVDVMLDVINRAHRCDA